MKLFYPGSFTCPITGADLNSIHLNTKVPTSVTEQLIARSTDIQSSFYAQPGEPARANHRENQVLEEASRALASFVD